MDKFHSSRTLPARLKTSALPKTARSKIKKGRGITNKSKKSVANAKIIKKGSPKNVFMCFEKKEDILVCIILYINKNTPKILNSNLNREVFESYPKLYPKIVFKYNNCLLESFYTVPQKFGTFYFFLVL